jgi:hypothetical protein
MRAQEQDEIHMLMMSSTGQMSTDENTYLFRIEPVRCVSTIQNKTSSNQWQTSSNVDLDRKNDRHDEKNCKC